MNISQQKDFYLKLINNFPFEATDDQQDFIRKISSFIIDPNQNLFVLGGYAGTGKTTLVNTLVKSLPSIKARSVLLAPTGRAAKVLAGYTGKNAFTIHKWIYNRQEDDGGIFRFALKANKYTNTLFIIDEASMIGESGAEGGILTSRSLLEDLFTYTFSGENCKVLLIGDAAQLPPVGMNVSPALNLKSLKQRMGEIPPFSALKQVMRQEKDSGILHNATLIRNAVRSKDFYVPKFELGGFKDVHRITGNELPDALNYCYREYGETESVLITRSNKRANQFNQLIKNRIKMHEDEICAGDLMMVVKNNYFWLNDESKASFIANGDAIELQRIRNIHEMYDFRFADAVIQLIDYPDQAPFECKILLNTLYAEAPALDKDQNELLYRNVSEDFAHIADKKVRMAELRKNPYLNALQVKFGYAITCHKAQGGQWDAVFVDQGYITEEMIDLGFLRWLYTAVSRAKTELYLVNFDDRFFINSFA